MLAGRWAIHEHETREQEDFKKISKKRRYQT